ncbi:MAG: DNA translocase FtsK 4TM domain-containing protein [Bacteroidales bacterium]|nr:DNA translocase FtsK 4TM domain-containing protein [Bacteroidales bacterium]
MAKKKKKKKPIISFLGSVVAFFKDDRFRYAMGIVFLLVALFMILSLISYLVNWKTDQDFEWAKVFSGPEVQVENSGGKMGAWLSNLLINKWFGLASFVFPAILVIWAMALYKIRLVKPGKSIRNSLILIVLLSITLGLMFGDAGGLLGSGPGGQHGYFLSKWLMASIGTFGTIFLLIICYTAMILFSTSFLERIRELENPFQAAGEAGGKEPAAEGDSEDAADPFVLTTMKPEEQADLPEETRGEETTGEIPGRDTGEQAAAGTDRESKGSDGRDDVEMTIEDVSGTNPNDFNPDEGALGEYDPTLDLPKYQYPPLSLLKEYDHGDTTVTNEELISNKNRIVETLSNYNIKIDKIKATIGPTVTLYEIVPAPGIRISKIKNLEDDIALSLSALGIRIIAPIPGKGTIGIEVPNQNPRIVSMKSILASKKFQDAEMELAIALGKTISNETFVFDLTKMPHLLVAGATGQGKSVGLNAIIASLLFKKHPAQLKFVMIDPKKVELSLYTKIERHYLAKLPESEEAIITDTQQVIHTLNSLCAEMDDRYNLLKAAQVRNIKEYNTKFINRKLNPNKGHRYLPFIVVIIDEFADLIMTAGREIEHPISRLAQLARAIGIHLIIATQRPTTNIITGVIKANFPARIAFRVTSMIDSRTILDGSGADQLIGRGDMLFLSSSEPIRLQCALIDGPEIEDVTDFIGQQKGYPTAMMLNPVEDGGSAGPDVDLDKRDDKFEEAARLVVQHQQGSTSLIQRKLSLGYNRAGRIVDQLEATGILGPFEGSKARQVLVQDEFSLEQILSKLS